MKSLAHIQRVRRLLREFKERRRKLVRQFVQFEEVKQATCRGLGCVGCCRQFAVAGLFEGALIADALLRQGKPELLRAAAEQGRRQMELAGNDPMMLVSRSDEVTAAWMDRNEMCALFDEQSRGCGLYALRPVSCSTYYVVSDPELCHGPSGNVVGAVNNQGAMGDMMALDSEFVQRALGDEQALVIPVPLGYAIWTGYLILREPEQLAAKAVGC